MMWSAVSTATGGDASFARHATPPFSLEKHFEQAQRTCKRQSCRMHGGDSRRLFSFSSCPEGASKSYSIFANQDAVLGTVDTRTANQEINLDNQHVTSCRQTNMPLGQISSANDRSLFGNRTPRVIRSSNRH